MLLVPIRTAASLKQGEAAQVDADLYVLVCREICIPGKARVSRSIPIRPEMPQPDARNREIFSAARKSLPKKAPSQWRVDVLEHSDSLILVGNLGREIRHAAFFPLAESQISNSAAQKIEPNANGFRLTLVKSDQLTKPIGRLKGVLEFSANESYRIDAPVGSAGASKEPRSRNRFQEDHIYEMRDRANIGIHPPAHSAGPGHARRESGPTRA